MGTVVGSAADTATPAESAESTQTAVAATAAGDDDAELVVSESGFSTEDQSGTQHTSAGAIITNPSATSVACNVQVQFTILDEAGAPIETTTENVDFIPPGASVPVAPLMIGFDAAAPASLAVSIVDVEDRAEGTSMSDCDVFFSLAEGVELPVEGVSISRDSFMAEVTGQVSNPSDTLIEMSSIDCVLRSETGEIVGGESTALLDPISPGGTIAFSTMLTSAPETAATAECRIVG